MTTHIPTISIVGRTNVGKSTLFNIIAGRKLSIVEDSPGVTRDRSYVYVKRHKFPFILVDTGGLVGEEDGDFAGSVRAQAEIAISESDIILAVLDGVDGVHPQDSDVVNYLRKSEKPVIWIVNKCEKPETELRSGEFYALGIDEPICISAAHNLHIDAIMRRLWIELGFNEETTFTKPEESDTAIRVAIIGKPNVGKSTLVNRLLGEDRLITSPVSGTTRDQIDIRFVYDGQEFLFVDTAGLRKKSKIDSGTIERFSNLRTLRALAQCDVAVLLIDATLGVPTDQDQKIASLAHERGKALVVVVNKWDAIEKDHKTAKEFKDTLFDKLRFCKYAPVLFVSALTGKRCQSIFSKVVEVLESTRRRVTTSELNKILEKAFRKNPPPVHRGVAIKLFFATQIEVAPPTFLLFVNYPRSISGAYQRYVRNTIRDAFGFDGTDIRIILRKRTQREEQAENGSPLE